MDKKTPDSQDNPTSPARGVFWIIDGKVHAFPFTGEITEGISKSGNTYNHKKLWDNVRPKKCKHPYNYYPRGRVEITSKGVSVIYMNPGIDESFIPDIMKEFNPEKQPIIKLDHSNHYKCYLDDGWQSDA
ncbi:MAG: hypothetical protein FWE83_07360 [Oscillospiraceae bacterium]|nr:hypothetical protein [Oscillospiraceae bacterium]